jgi:hypothetical protein
MREGSESELGNEGLLRIRFAKIASSQRARARRRITEHRRMHAESTDSMDFGLLRVDSHIDHPDSSR